MIVLGEFRNVYGERFVVSRAGSEVWIDGDEFGWAPQNVRRCRFTFSSDEKAALDRIVPLVWDFVPYNFTLAALHAKPSAEWDEGDLDGLMFTMRGVVERGGLAEETHGAGSWMIWDSAEQEAFLQENAAKLTLGQYAMMRGYSAPAEGAAFLHTFGQRLGCSFVTHRRHPERCWFGSYDTTMAQYFDDCSQYAALADQRFAAR
jgi:hypothetical protein